MAERRRRKPGSAGEHGCIEAINGGLKDSGRDLMLSVREDGPGHTPKMRIALEPIGGGDVDLTRFMLTTYCPFCGVEMERQS